MAVTTIAFLFFLGISSFADAKDGDDQCALKGKSFTLKQVVTNPAEEEPDTVNLLSISGTQVEKIYSGNAIVLDGRVTKSLCKHSLVLDAGAGTVAIFITEDNRPHGSRVRIILFDLTKKTVVSNDRYAEHDDPKSLQIRERPKGVALLTQWQPSDSVACNKDCPLVMGRKTKSISDDPLPIWRTYDFANGKLIEGVDKGLTFATSPIKRFFKSQDEFVRAFDGFKTSWYRIVTFEDGTEKVGAAPERHLPKTWFP